MKNSYFLLFLSILGFFNAYFLHWQYKRFLKTKKKMFCLIGQDCTKVVSSSYGKTLGIKNELIGMLYYAVLFILTIMTFISPPLTSFINAIIFFISLVAFVFSIYLLFVQTNILATFCSWCLFAIILNTLIFLVVFI